MTHITLNTGHQTTVTRKVSTKERRTCRALWPAGGNLPGVLSAFRVDFGGGDGSASFALWRGQAPIVLNMVCWRESASEAAWNAIEQQYFNLAKTPNQVLGNEFCDRPSTPWLATVLLPGLLTTAQDDVSWLASWEYAMAQTIITIKTNA